MFDSTIVAISTALSPGAIGIVRMSGSYAVGIAENIFTPCNKSKQLSKLSGYTSVLGTLKHNGQLIDECIAHIYKAPKSFTGEDVIEFSCHGGVFVLNKVYRALIELGAVPAPPGEFSKRAYINGKFSLAQAESVISLINAENDSELKLALDNKNGYIAGEISKLKHILINIAAQIAVYIDYPEDDVPQPEFEVLKNSLLTVQNDIEQYITNFDNGYILRNGIDCAIVGKSNVGKSTFMNALLKCDRSIVTDIAGTTRDIIEDTARIGQYTIKLKDTAGIRDTDDVVENIGIEKSLKTLQSADLVLFIFDRSKPLDKNDSKLIDLVNQKNTIYIFNKSDLKNVVDKSALPPMKYKLDISATDDSFVNELLEVLNEIFAEGIEAVQQPTVLNERQRNCLQRANQSAQEAATALISNVTYDIVGVLVEDSINCLLELTGESASQSIVDEIFEKFCVGK